MAALQEQTEKKTIPSGLLASYNIGWGLMSATSEKDLLRGRRKSKSEWINETMC